MAGDWIKLEHATPDKPEVWEMAQMLNLDADAIVGKLVRVWIWADQNCNATGVTSVTLLYGADRITGVTGFGKAMQSVGWLSSDGTTLTLPNFNRHNGKPAKTRAVTKKRVTSHRAENCNGASVTSALPEKRREESTPKAPKKPKSWEPDETQKRLNRLFNRKDSTVWDPKEIKALKALKIDAETFDLVCAYYSADIPEGSTHCFRRKKLLTLLNNWADAIDNATAWRADRNGRGRKLRPITLD